MNYNERILNDDYVIREQDKDYTLNFQEDDWSVISEGAHSYIKYNHKTIAQLDIPVFFMYIHNNSLIVSDESKYLKISRCGRIETFDTLKTESYPLPYETINSGRILYPNIFNISDTSSLTQHCKGFLLFEHKETGLKYKIDSEGIPAGSRNNHLIWKIQNKIGNYDIIDMNYKA